MRFTCDTSVTTVVDFELDDTLIWLPLRFIEADADIFDPGRAALYVGGGDIGPLEFGLSVAETSVLMLPLDCALPLAEPLVGDWWSVPATRSVPL